VQYQHSLLFAGTLTKCPAPGAWILFQSPAFWAICCLYGWWRGHELLL